MDSVLYEDGLVRITTTKAAFPQGTYAAGAIQAVRVARIEPSGGPLLAAGFGAVALVLAASGVIQGHLVLGGSAGMTVIGVGVGVVAVVLLVGAGVGFAVRDPRPTWRIVLVTSSGDRSVFATRDGDEADAIQGALEKLIG